MGKILRLGLITGAVLILVIVCGGWLYLRASLPVSRGVLSVKGLNAPVEIVRDADGVPHIYATTDHDAFFALGYVHAQDRLWQLETQRRTGAGRLSELHGRAALVSDKFYRTLGLARAAKAAWTALSEPSRGVLTAYTAGINAWIEAGHILPPEFVLLRTRPESWTVYDSLVWGKMISLNLGRNRRTELLRAQTRAALSPEQAAQLLPTDHATMDASLSDTLRSAPGMETFVMPDTGLEDTFPTLDGGAGSNTWVVAGSHTTSGLPLLAADPHLVVHIPSPWYLAELKGETLHVVGATIPGLPMVVVGHNDRIAWGLANLAADTQDYYLERLNPDDPNQYEVDGQWVEMVLIEEQIGVKGLPQPVSWTVRHTRHGPLLSDAFRSEVSPMALRWTSLDPDDTTMDAMLNLQYAKDWAAFKVALRDHVTPTLAFVYADVGGNIGYIGAGRIPIRSQGHGMVPVPGWDNQYTWQGWIPFNELPQAFNPASGFIVAANHRIVGKDYPHFLTNDWEESYRANRITERLRHLRREGRQLSPQDMIELQADQTSMPARHLLALLLPIEPADARQGQALDIIQAWDGVMRRDQVAPSIYAAWFLQLNRVILENDLPDALASRFARRHNAMFLETVLADANNSWCDNRQTTVTETCADMARQALDHALNDLEQRLGNDMTHWHWGNLHQTQYAHFPFSRIGLLKRFFHRQIPSGGGAFTVNFGIFRTTEPYGQYRGALYRQVVDLSNLQESLFITTPGQSGHVLSRHYDDLMERHRDVQYLPMQFGSKPVDGDVLILQPL